MHRRDLCVIRRSAHTETGPDYEIRGDFSARGSHRNTAQHSDYVRNVARLTSCRHSAQRTGAHGQLGPSVLGHRPSNAPSFTYVYAARSTLARKSECMRLRVTMLGAIAIAMYRHARVRSRWPHIIAQYCEPAGRTQQPPNGDGRSSRKPGCARRAPERDGSHISVMKYWHIDAMLSTHRCTRASIVLNNAWRWWWWCCCSS